MRRAAAALALQLAALSHLKVQAAKEGDWPEDVALLEEEHNCWSPNGTRIDLTQSLGGLSQFLRPTVADCAQAALKNPSCGAAIELRRPDSMHSFCACGMKTSANVVCQQELADKRKNTSSDVYALHGVHYRTAERVAAGKRAAQHIACLVCEARMVSAWPDEQNAEEVFESGAFADWLSDVKELCSMKNLNMVLRALRLQVNGLPDGTATLEPLPKGSLPFYTGDDEAMVGPLFHWKSFAVRHACAEIFRKDAEALAEAFAEAWPELEEEAAEAEGPGAQPTFLAAKAACKKASRMCKAANKKLEKAGRPTSTMINTKSEAAAPPAGDGPPAGGGEAPQTPQEEL